VTGTFASPFRVSPPYQNAAIIDEETLPYAPTRIGQGGAR